MPITENDPGAVHAATVHSDSVSAGRKIIRFVTRAVLCLLIIAIGVAASVYFIRSAPKASRRKPVKMVPLVQTVKVQPQSYEVTVEAMGVVTASRELVLKARVAGQIEWLHPSFTQGGLLQAGDLVLRIDRQDYELDLKQKRRAVSQARYEIAIEKGRQDVARREWELVNDEPEIKPGESDLALRKPHLERVKAELAAAEAQLAQAELALTRTQVSMPFNALVRNKYVDIGAQISPQERLADLVDTDTYWVQVAIGVDRLHWITIPRQNGEPGARARILYRDSHHRTGKVIRLLGDLDTEGRMARVLVAVKDPLDLKSPDRQRPPLLMGEYVRVQIAGQVLQDVFAIPRSALHEDRFIWLMNRSDQLEIRPVKVVWRDKQQVVIQQGLNAGDRLIVSDLAAPVAGMQLTGTLGAARKKNSKEHVN